MNRRSFLGKLFIGGAAAAASVKAIPALIRNLPVEDIRSVPNLCMADIEPGGWVSYKFRYTTSMSPDSRFRIRHKEVQADY